MLEATLFGGVPGEPRPPLELDGEAELAALVALAGLSRMSPVALWALLDSACPTEIWARVCAGTIRGPASDQKRREQWTIDARQARPGALLDRHRRSGIEIWPHGCPGAPSELVDDPDPPPVVFATGPLPPGRRPRVGIVGTRAATGMGLDIAREVGGRLAARNVHVVSGLAKGIDGAAHRGVVDEQATCAIGVVPGGLDKVYPRANRDLWRQVSQHGVLLSEWPLGSSPLPWRFPARNRLIAALSDAVVVVESAAKGGSMYTVDEALRRDRRVIAVPGPIRSSVSVGTNRLAADGAEILWSIDTFIDDIAPAVGVSRAETGDEGDPALAQWLLDAIGWGPAPFDLVVERSGRPLLDVQVELERQIAAGCVVRRGGLVERLA